MRILIAVTAAWALVVQASVLVLAQSVQAPPPERRFEVASVKPSLLVELDPRVGLIHTLPGGRFIAEARLKQLIVHAFEVRNFQVEGGPPWLASDYFEITANAGTDATPADVKAMLRTLLAERFGLRTRTETRQTSVYMLTVARSDGTLGPRLTRATPECIQQIAQKQNGTAPVAAPPTAAEAEREITRMMSRDFPPGCGSYMDGSSWNGASRLVFGGAELSVLVSLISSQLSAPVVDRTGLSGLFNVALEYMSERPLSGRPAGLDPNGIDVPPPPPALGVALERQLGLKLEKQIGPMPVVIVMAADRPTPN